MRRTVLKPIHFWSRRRFMTWSLVIAASGLATAVGAHGMPLFAVVDAQRPMDARVAGGAVMIVGGGAVTPAIRKRFVELAGGINARIVLVPGYDPGADGEESLLSPWRSSGMASIILLNARDRSTANDPAFCAPLKEATGVWFGGGFQSYLAERYVDTAVQDCLHDLLKRNGVVGGCSAGAAILSRVMIREGDTTPVEARGLDLVANAIIDQHFLARNRLWRLEQMVEAHPDLVGLGVDEATGLVIQPRTKQLSVVGESYVVACFPSAGPHPQRIEILKPGDAVTLPQLRHDHLAYHPIDSAYAVSGTH
jgi:cyanophycinase